MIYIKNTHYVNDNNEFYNILHSNNVGNNNITIRIANIIAYSWLNPTIALIRLLGFCQAATLFHLVSFSFRYKRVK